MGGLLLVGASGLTREASVIERAIARFRAIRIVDDDPARSGQEHDGGGSRGSLSSACPTTGTPA